MKTALTQTLTMSQMEEWARLTSDYNPMHLDAEFTRNTAYGRPIVFATLTLAIVSEALEARFGTRWLEGGTLDVRFVGPVLVGDDFTVEIDETDGNTEVSCGSGGNAPLALVLELPLQSTDVASDVSSGRTDRG